MADISQKDKELIELGRKVKELFELGYVSKREALLDSFLKGVMTGLGVAIGSTLVVAILLWLLSNLQEMPFVGPISDSVRHTIEERR